MLKPYQKLPFKQNNNNKTGTWDLTYRFQVRSTEFLIYTIGQLFSFDPELY